MEQQPSPPADLSDARILDVLARLTTLPYPSGRAAREKVVTRVRRQIWTIICPGDEITDDAIVQALKTHAPLAQSSKRQGRPGASEGRARPK